jgi:hypothetical protein
MASHRHAAVLTRLIANMADPQNPARTQNFRRTARILLGCAVVFLLLGFVSSATKARVDRYLPLPKGSHTITNVIRMEEKHLPLAETAVVENTSWESCKLGSEPLPPTPEIQLKSDVILAFYPLRSPPSQTA